MCSGASRATPSAAGVVRAIPDIPHSVAAPVARLAGRVGERTRPVAVRQYPAVSSPPAPSTKARTTAGPVGGSASPRSRTDRRRRPGRRPAPRPGQPGSSGATATGVDRPGRPGPRAPRSSTTVAEPEHVRPSWWTRSRTVVDVLGDVLVDHRVGEPGQAEPVPIDRRLDLGAGQRRATRARPPIARLGEVQLGAHARTPTRTLRKRAGAAGWPVWPTWPGWPLPQFGVPQATISDESMSIDAQNRGPIPV